MFVFVVCMLRTISPGLMIRNHQVVRYVVRLNSRAFRPRDKSSLKWKTLNLQHITQKKVGIEMILRSEMRELQVERQHSSNISQSIRKLVSLFSFMTVNSYLWLKSGYSNRFRELFGNLCWYVCVCERGRIEVSEKIDTGLDRFMIIGSR